MTSSTNELNAALDLALDRNKYNSNSLLISNSCKSRQDFLLCGVPLTRVPFKTHTFQSLLRYYVDGRNQGLALIQFWNDVFIKLELECRGKSLLERDSI